LKQTRKNRVKRVLTKIEIFDFRAEETFKENELEWQNTGGLFWGRKSAEKKAQGGPYRTGKRGSTYEELGGVKEVEKTRGLRP